MPNQTSDISSFFHSLADKKESNKSAMVLINAAMTTISDKYQRRREHIVSSIREQYIVRARHELFYVLLRDTHYSPTWLGERLGFERSTILYGAAKHARMLGIPAARGNYYDTWKKWQRSEKAA